MKLLEIAELAFALSAMSALSLAQDYPIVPHNKIAFTPTAAVSLSNDNFTYTFKLANGISAEQAVWDFRVFPVGNVRIASKDSPADWHVFDHTHGVNRELDFSAAPMDTIDAYIAPIKPGQSLSGFSFSTSALPGIVTYYAEGDGPEPYFEEGQATDEPIPGYDDLTPYGPGVVGRTVGPVQPPDPLVMLGFVDTLSSYVNQSVTLGWLITHNDGTADALLRDLKSARRYLEKGDSVNARSYLDKFLKEVEDTYASSQQAQQKGNKAGVIMTNECYYVLKYNGEYLRDKLPTTK